MPEPIEEIMETLSPELSETVNEKRIQLADGTYKIITRKIERVSREGGGIRTQAIDEIILDDLGRKIASVDDIGGQCTCGNIVQKDNFNLCQRCGRPQCSRCASVIEGVHYCSWCSFVIGFRNLFRRRAPNGR